MKKYDLFFIVILFFLIYEPPFFNINTLHIIGFISWSYILFNFKDVKETIKIGTISKIYFIFVLFWTYLSIVITLNGNSILNSLSFLYWIFDVIPASIMLTTHFMKKRYSINDFLNILLIVGTMQGIFALIAFLNPDVKNYFVNQLINYGYSTNFYSLSDFRLFGFASNLTFTTPIVQIILAAVSFYLAIYSNVKYILYTPLLIFSSIINARTSLVIMGVAILSILIVFKKLKLKEIIRFFIISTTSYLIFIYGNYFLQERSYGTLNWIKSGYDDILLFLKNDTSGSNGYFAYVSDSSKYTFPEGLGALFGVGERILGFNSYGVRSDIGYINDIWLGGMLYSILIYLFFMALLLDIYKSKNDEEISKFLFLILLGTLLITNVKGYIIVTNNFTTLFFIIYVFVATNKKLLNSNKITVNSIFRKSGKGRVDSL